MHRQWVAGAIVSSIVAISASLVACSDDGGEGGNGGGSTSAGAGSGGMSGAPTAGTANGGTSGGGVSGSSTGGKPTGGSATGGKPSGGGSGLGTTGDPCTQNSDCSSETDEPAECITAWPGGYCSGPCALYLECSGDTDDAACETANGKKRCLEACAAESACRDGYRCDLDIFACVAE